MKVTFQVNGDLVTLDVEPGRTLLSILREELGLMGTKPGCEVGDCGACSVLVDGKRENSCLLTAKALSDTEVTTIEGLSTEDGSPSILQQAFITQGATQCGYCTPGMIVASEALLSTNLDPTREDIRMGLQDNLCRCTGYIQIMEAVELAAEQRRKGPGGQDD